MGARGPKPRPATERFWPRVNKNGPVPEYAPHLGACWIWTGGKSSEGYGHFQAGTGNLTSRQMQAHQFAFEELIGPVPFGLVLDHLCRIRLCVRPDHLEPVTHQVNIARGQCPSAIIVRSGKCKRGHPRTPDNLTRNANGKGHQCKTCNREDARQRKLDGKMTQSYRGNTCRRGHLHNAKNSYIRPDGSRECRTCIWDRQAERCVGGIAPETRAECKWGHSFAKFGWYENSTAGTRACKRCAWEKRRGIHALQISRKDK